MGSHAQHHFEQDLDSTFSNNSKEEKRRNTKTDRNTMKSRTRRRFNSAEIAMKDNR